MGGGRLAILDLALTGDVPRGGADLPGVTRIDLDSVREAVPATQISDLDVARGLVAAGVEGFLAEERARSPDPAVPGRPRRPSPRLPGSPGWDAASMNGAHPRRGGPCARLRRP
ncbi:MAG: hypothetical protein L0J79_07665, partial [Propionibacterium sp.]|nr:hypothetical protein [Propionibacterium sp.]